MTPQQTLQHYSEMEVASREQFHEIADAARARPLPMTPEQKSFYDLGFATAIKQRMDRDRAETEQLFRQCVRIPEQTEPLMRSK